MGAPIHEEFAFEWASKHKDGYLKLNWGLFALIGGTLALSVETSTIETMERSFPVILLGAWSVLFITLCHQGWLLFFNLEVVRTYTEHLLSRSRYLKAVDDNTQDAEKVIVNPDKTETSFTPSDSYVKTQAIYEKHLVKSEARLKWSAGGYFIGVGLNLLFYFLIYL